MPISRLIPMARRASRPTATSMMSKWKGEVIIPRDTMSVVAPAGGCVTRHRTMRAPVAASDRDVASRRGQLTPSLMAEGAVQQSGQPQRPVATQQAEGMAQQGITRTGHRCQGSGKKKESGRPQGGEDHGRTGDHRQGGQQSEGQETGEEHERGIDQASKPTLRDAAEPQAPGERLSQFHLAGLIRPREGRPLPEKRQSVRLIKPRF